MLVTGQNEIQAKIFKPRLFLYFLCFLSLIIHELRLVSKENWKSTYNVA